MGYPCRGCIVFVTCSKLCGKIVLERDEILSFMLEFKRCIDCGGTKCLEYSSIMEGVRYLLCTSCNSIYTMETEKVHKFDRRTKHKGPAPSKENGAVFDGIPTTFVDFLAKHIGKFTGEGRNGISM
jgi:hypothetical protein